MPTRLWLALALLCSGCASTKWVKPGTTQEDWVNDRQQCVIYARSLTVGATGMVAGWARDKHFSECMMERGWKQQ